MRPEWENYCPDHVIFIGDHGTPPQYYGRGYTSRKRDHKGGAIEVDIIRNRHLLNEPKRVDTPSK
jgi:hypothetical protein